LHGYLDWEEAAARSVIDALKAKPGALQVTGRVAFGVVDMTFRHPDTMANVVTTDSSDRATNCPEYKCMAVQVSSSNGRTHCYEGVTAFAGNSHRIATGGRLRSLAQILGPPDAQPDQISSAERWHGI
jgi:formate dehydrogenase major subunit